MNTAEGSILGRPLQSEMAMREALYAVVAVAVMTDLIITMALIFVRLRKRFGQIRTGLLAIGFNVLALTATIIWLRDLPWPLWHLVFVLALECIEWLTLRRKRGNQTCRD